MKQTPSKHSKHELKRLIEEGVRDICGLPRTGLWFSIDEVEYKGKPPSDIHAWATLHFLMEGSPFCCQEPGCHLLLFGDRLAELNERMRHAMGLRQDVSVEFTIKTSVAEGVRFRVIEDNKRVK